MDADRRLVAAEVETDSGFRVLERETLFTLGPDYLLNEATDFYDIAPDDQQFLMGRRGGVASGADSRFILVQNFFEVLKERVGNR